MREVVAICRSSKKERVRVARVLDRYFWRIGDRTWRGKATNACLDRVSRELRVKANRSTAVVVHEIRSSHESRVPIIRIGARHAFSETGIAPIAARPARAAAFTPPSPSRAVVRIAALFHDLGKATILFQDKLRRALEGGEPEADPVRHELHSAAVWDHLFGAIYDDALPAALQTLEPETIDAACEAVRPLLTKIAIAPHSKFPFVFLKRENSLSYAIGMLILTHHRLPAGDTDLLAPLASRHARPPGEIDILHALSIAPGTSFWHQSWWLTALKQDAHALRPGHPVLGLDIYLRAALMMGDHYGSSNKAVSSTIPEHLANTIRKQTGTGIAPADSLSLHVRRVHAAARHGVDLFERYADGFPALDEAETPVEIVHPVPSADPRFQWQAEAAREARALCEAREGGFFACSMAGTGTGKTRGAPTILAGAAFGDARPERRYLRMSLGLGLRVLATQSAAEYVSDLGFNDQDVAVLVGQAPLTFAQGEDSDEVDSTGSESHIEIPEWLKIEMATGGVPDPDDPREADWLRGLSIDTGRGLPAFCEKIIAAADPGKGKGPKATAARRLLQTPLVVGTLDHLMGVAAPVNARYLLQALRVATSDLVLDEIDQFDGEDIAAIGRLVYQSAAAGRRVIVMSATLTPDIATALHAAYRQGWSAYAAARGVSDHVNLLVTGDAPGSCRTNAEGDTLETLLAESSSVTLAALADAPAARRGAILPPCNEWNSLVSQIDTACHRLHDMNAVNLEGFKVSFGMIRITRISHTAALAAQLPSGEIENRLRVTLCLHSQFPRLHRSWIESRLKRALTRKDSDPNAGLQSFCHAEDIFERAAAASVRDIEIVLITSPVIETGNDLDFDWAILDPISTRSIIQAAGRVWRHRPVGGSGTNVMILGRSPIAIQGGKLSRPGVETKLHQDTLVSAPTLDAFESRFFSELAGAADFSVITAAPIIQQGICFPLRDAEAELRGKMIGANADKAEAPLGRYIRRVSSRLTQRMPTVRCFRRSDTRSILYKLVGEDFASAQWFRDLAPGTRDSALAEARHLDLSTALEEACHVFETKTLTNQAWQDHAPGRNASQQEIGQLMQIEIPDYGDDGEPMMTYTEFTGFTRGSIEDLLAPFGKAIKKQ